VAETVVGSLYLRVVNGIHHPSGIMHALANRLGVREMKVMHRTEGWQTPMERVIAVLQNSGRLLLFDEAHKLTDRALEALRDVHDSTGVPILLIGVKDLHDRITRGVDADHGQMYSRFDIIQHLSQGRDQYSGGKPLFSVAEIKQLYQQPPIRLSPDAIDYLQGVANMLGHGSLRRCKTLLANAVRRARKRQNLTEEDRVTVTADDLGWVESRLRQESAEQDAVAYRKQRAVAGNAT
jgi:hypothetical protein